MVDLGIGTGWNMSMFFMFRFLADLVDSLNGGAVFSRPAALTRPPPRVPRIDPHAPPPPHMATPISRRPPGRRRRNMALSSQSLRRVTPLLSVERAEARCVQRARRLHRGSRCVGLFAQ